MAIFGTRKFAFHRKLRDFWLFHSWVNFTATVTTLGFSFIVYQNYRKKKFFKNIYVEDAMEKFNKSPRIIEEIGTPVIPRISGKAKMFNTDDQFGYEFLMSGPEGKITASVIGSGKKIKDMTEEDLKKYTIPSEDGLKKALEMKDTGEEESLTKTLDPEETLWKFDYIAAESRITGKKIVVYSDSSIMDDKTEIEVKKTEPFSKNYRYLLELREKQLKSNVLSKDEEADVDLDQVSKARMQQWYRSIGEIRFYFLLGMFITGMCIYIFVKKYKRHGVSTGELQSIVDSIIHNHPLFHKQIGRNVKINKTFRGSNIDGIAEYDFEVSGEKGRGIIEVKGKFHQKKYSWELLNLDLKMKNSEKKFSLKM